MTTTWSEVFDEMHPESGASAEQLARLNERVQRPMSQAEIAEVNATQVNPFSPQDPAYGTWRAFDAGDWELPSRPLPPSYLDFLSFSDGGAFRSGERWFDTFLTSDELREYQLDYQVPEYMPGAFLFALDGSGNFYLFDMRAPPSEDGEYPVVFAQSGNLGFEDALLVSSTFLGACRGKGEPAD